jgi:hypothetical protein
MRNVYIVLILGLLLVQPTIVAIVLTSKVETNQLLLNENRADIKSINLTIDKIKVAQDKQSEDIVFLRATQTGNDKHSGIINTDSQGKILAATSGVYAILEKDDSLIGESISCLMTKSLWEIHQPILKSIAEDGKDSVMSKRVMKLNGKFVQINVYYLTTKQMFMINLKEV